MECRGRCEPAPPTKRPPPGPDPIAGVGVQRARLSGVLGQRVQASHDAASEITGGKRRRHRHRTERRCAVVKGPGGVIPGQDLQSPGSRIHEHHHRRTCAPTESAEQPTTVRAEVFVRRTDVDRVGQSTLLLGLPQRTFDRTRLAGRKSITSGHYNPRPR